MKNKNFLIGLFLLTIFNTSCLKTGYLKYQKKPDEIVTGTKIKEFIKNNPNPSIVLKVPNTENKSTQSDPNNYIYSTIEKELTKAGFNVKDRGLFNEIVSKADAINYNDLKKLTGTDLILELVRIDRSVQYMTNTLYTQKNEERIYDNASFTRLGALIEFKITIIENNDFGGSYSFHYAPCGEGENNNCRCQIGYKKFPNKYYEYLNMCEKVDSKKKIEAIETNFMEEFVKIGVKRMISEIRK